MALSIGSVVAKFQSDVADFRKGVSEVKSEMSTLGNSVERTMRGAEDASKKFALALGAGATALAGFVGYGSKVAGDLEAARQGFVALLGSAEKADAVMSRIKLEAAATPFELPGLVAGTQALAAITKNGDQAVDILLDVGKAIATSGKGQAELDRVILNLQQIASTGKLTAMDIRQFQGAIPIFNDIVEASGHTVAGLQEADNAAELLFEAFRKAGQEGGMTAEGFTSQAGTFNQLVSNMKDNVTILASEIVKQTGAFDFLKNAIEAVNGVLGDQDSIIGGIKSFLEFLQKYGIIVAGGIIGALVPAFYAWASAIGALVVSLAPFIIIGLAVGAAITAIIAIVRNWGDIMNWIQTVWDQVTSSIQTTLTETYEAYILPILTAIADTFTWLWEVYIKPIIDKVVAYFRFWYDMLSWVWNNLMYPILYLIASIYTRIFYEIWGVIKTVTETIVNFLTKQWTDFWNWFSPYLERLGKFVSDTWNWISQETQKAWGWIRDNIVKPITDAKQKADETVEGISNKVTGTFEGLVTKVRQAWERIKNAIVEPFEAAKRKVEEIANAIKSAVDKINPFHRESPSLVDNVRAGVKAIQDAYDGIGVNLASPSISQAGIGVGSGGNVININLSGANITSPEVAEEYAELIGDMIIGKLGKTARVI